MTIKSTPPKVLSSRLALNPAFQGFPLEHYSYSAWSRFSTNPFMFKVNNINGDQLETTSSPINILGKAAHHGLQTYFGGNDAVPVPANDDGEAMRLAFEAGTAFLNNYSDGLIGYNSTIPDRAKLTERFAFAFLSYLKELNFDPTKQQTVFVERMLKHRVSVDGRELPVPLKGSADWVYRGTDGRLHIKDHKFVGKYSDPETIDGSKLLQAVFNYLLVYAETGEAPLDITFAEHKVVPNQDHSPQTREIVIVYDETPLAFDLFFRFYQDITDALMGKQVYVPNLMAIFDKEVSLLAYIHRLDVDEERAAALARMKVDNITDFLKKRLQKDGAMKKYLEVVGSKFISADTLNYKNMTIPERIKMKLAEHGLGVEFHSQVVGSAVTLYRYEPSVGLKMGRIEKFVKDLEQVTGTTGIRILAPIPDSELIGFELPNKTRTFAGSGPKSKGWEIPLGVDISGQPFFFDPRQAPHTLLAGATGSGKSMTLGYLVSRLLERPDALLVLLDPKKVELQDFAEHKRVLSYRDDIMGIHKQLGTMVAEMDRRYTVLKQGKVKNIEQHNAKGGKLPYLFVVIDEYGDLIVQEYTNEETVPAGEYLSGPRKGEPRFDTVKTDISGEIRQRILQLAQKARAAGIYLILTTQHPLAKIVDSAIKANFPARIAFRTTSASGSQVIIDQDGAEKLLGKGDMLLQWSDGSPIKRLQGYTV